MQIIMLNTNVFGRPFDKLGSKEIMDEALASYKIFSVAYSGLIEVKTSDVLFSEVSMIKDELKRKFVVNRKTTTAGYRPAACSLTPFARVVLLRPCVFHHSHH